MWSTINVSTIIFCLTQSSIINLFHDKIIHISVKVFKNGANKIYGEDKL